MSALVHQIKLVKQGRLNRVPEPKRGSIKKLCIEFRLLMDNTHLAFFLHVQDSMSHVFSMGDIGCGSDPNPKFIVPSN